MDEIIQKAAEKNNLSKEQGVELFEHLFRSARGYMIKMEMPRVVIRKFCTFVPVIGRLTTKIEGFENHLNYQEKESIREKVKERIDKYKETQERLVKEINQRRKRRK